MLVSVPFPGILFLNKEKVEIYDNEDDSFRPLPGDLISQSIRKKVDKLIHIVSVPFPGILFLNPVLYMPDLNWIPKPNCGTKPNPTLE